jgi:hypothetical protein
VAFSTQLPKLACVVILFMDGHPRAVRRMNRCGWKCSVKTFPSSALESFKALTKLFWLFACVVAVFVYLFSDRIKKFFPLSISVFNKTSKSLRNSSAANNWKFLVDFESLRSNSSEMKIFVAARDQINAWVVEH